VPDDNSETPPPDVNPLVVAAPVVAAAVCRDGIVLLAGHAAGSWRSPSPVSDTDSPPEEGLDKTEPTVVTNSLLLHTKPVVAVDLARMCESE
jgi:hypothetical protein